MRPVTRRGQNFLIDHNLLQVLVDAAELTPQDVVLEVGTGTGALTALIAQRVTAVVTVEIDRHLFALASEQLLGQPNVTLLCLDALASKNRLEPRVLEAVAQHTQQAPSCQWKLVANLPFNVATPVLSNLLAGPVVPSTMTVTIQKELAERIAAAPQTKAYSALSLWIQSQCHVRIVRMLPPAVFWPRPKVTGAMIHLVVDADRRQGIADLGYWHQFVRAVFLQRRKFLRTVLLSTFKRRLSKADVDAILEQLGLGPSTRAEQLDVATMRSLCEAVRAKAPDWRR
ncbi:MAG: ribosomal RNA small subunit methyltransferase A [Planctomycetes bacterium RBG_16_64_10]|nr:MAG: ribosomal RNA small subunit methyltransferase A [Planctomycetes bacterium RBG_16_64_10]